MGQRQSKELKRTTYSRKQTWDEEYEELRRKIILSKKRIKQRLMQR